MKLKYLLTILLLTITLSTNAEVTLDGTLGSSNHLPGPNYLVGADLGRQLGGNLFHSFQDFNLNSLESATFSGPNSVQNILSRVTGGNPSNIDGLIRSTIPNADMYFLNPYGIMFGPNAQLDVQGFFHASTADYLRLGENGRFDARNPSDSLLTIGGDIYFTQGLDELPLESLDEGSSEEFQAMQYRNQRFSQLYAAGGTIQYSIV
jgi:filamentous hemagglutinin family protein